MLLRCYYYAGNLRGVLEQLQPFDLQQLTPAHPAAAEAWQQHLQEPLRPANSAYMAPHQLHIQQHAHHNPLQQNQRLQKQRQEQSKPGAGQDGVVLLQQDLTLWRAYQVLSFLSHVSSADHFDAVAGLQLVTQHLFQTAPCSRTS
jgi:hypothetical protein